MTGVALSTTWAVLLFISNWSSGPSFLGVFFGAAFRPSFSSKSMRSKATGVKGTAFGTVKAARKHHMILSSKDKDSDQDEAPVTDKNIWEKAVEAEENLVRSLTGNDSYEFGQFTKNFTQAAVTTTEETIRSVTDNDDYQFGDFTKTVVGNVTASAENLLLENDAALFQVVNDYFHRLPSGITSSLQQLSKDVSNEEETSLVIALQLIAFVGLPLHFVLNVCQSCSIIAAWTYACWTNAGAIPTVSSVLGLVAPPIFRSSSPKFWTVFLQTQAAIRVFFGPVMLPVQVGATFFLCTKYRDVVLWMEQKLKNKTKNPVAVRLVALVTSWLAGNCIGLAAFTGVSCSAAGMVCRVLAK